VGKTICVADVEIRDSMGTLVAVGRACYASPRPAKEGP
jgi:acyl-coenzyme A thioesterase PaaI-like protein